jgi:HD-like signal output (HDOD) protein
VTEVSELLAAGGMPDTDRLINIVHMDPLVVASVLRRINSAYYGMRRQFQDIRKAILMIGFIEVCNIVMTSGYMGLRKVVTSNTQLAIIDRVMRVSIGSGFYANLLAQHLKLPDKSSAFTSGLLHSIGRMVLLYNMPEEYSRLCTRGSKLIPSAKEELDMLGVDHPTIGALAAQHWNFPELIASLIESYLKPGHMITPDQRTLALVLASSVEFSERLCESYDNVRATAPTGGSPENTFEDIAFPLNVTIPERLAHLAKDRNIQENTLEDLLQSHQEEALQYIELMVHTS